MAKAETTSSPARAPRGTKPVTQAFFAALDAVPEAARSAVAKAAQTMIRDELKSRREKAKAAAGKAKAREAGATKRTAVTASPKPAEPETAVPAKLRSRKRAGAPGAA